MWSIWNKKTDINGFSADWYLNRHPSLKNEEVVFIKTVNGRVVQTEGKNALAYVYNIDPSLPDDEFIEEYERIINLPPEPEDTDTTTYSELEQVYREGVNSIE